MFDSPSVCVIATSLPDKTLLFILDLPPLTLIPPLAILLLEIIVLASAIVMKLPVKSLPSIAILPLFKIRSAFEIFDSVMVKLDSSSVEMTFESSKVIFLMVTFAPSRT